MTFNWREVLWFTGVAVLTVVVAIVGVRVIAEAVRHPRCYPCEDAAFLQGAK